MNFKRSTSLILALILAMQTPASVMAEAWHSEENAPRLHTVTLTADEYTGELMPLESAYSAMADEGDYLRNANGMVDTRVESTYQANQTLVSVSLAGTSFSFAPQMLDVYTPQVLETASPEDENETALSSEKSETPAPSETPAATLEANDTPMPTAMPLLLSEGYACTLGQVAVYKAAQGDEQLGILPEAAVVYVTSVPDARAQVAFDTESGLVEGFVSAEALINLTEAEGQQVQQDVQVQPDVRVYQGNPLLRISGYAPNVQAAEQPDATIEPMATQTPEEPEAAEDPTSTPEAANTPDVRPTELPTPEASAEPTDEPTVSPSIEPTVAATQTPADTPKPESTQIPGEETSAEPSNSSTPAPTQTSKEELTPEPQNPSTPEPTQEPVIESTAEPIEEPTTEPEETFVPETEPQPEPSEANSAVATEARQGFNAWLRKLIPAAYAEENRPSSIAGQRIRSRARSAANGVSAVVYPGLFDAVTDVQLSLTTTGVKEDILVGQYTGNHVYTYRLSTEGLSAQQAGQEILLIDENGNVLAKLEAPNMTDAEGQYSTEIAVELTGSGNRYTVTYRPSDEWMREAAYPVTIDPTGNYVNDLATNIGDVYVSSANAGRHYDHTVPSGSSQRNHNLEGNNLYAGNNGSDNIALVIPSLTGFGDSKSSAFPETPLLIQSATWHVNIHEMGGDGRFRLSLVTSGWNTADVTYNSRPSLSSNIYVDVSLHTGWNDIDVTRLFSAWFNALDQKQNYGIAVTSSSSWARICSSDVLPRTDRMNFSATYYTGVGTPTVSAAGKGHGVNSQSGWAELSWNSIAGAQGYVLGVYNGREYEYRYIGNTTSYSTKDKRLWPTAAEIAAGKYALHWDGTGQELPNIPRVNQSDLNYYFRVLPSNAYGQVASSATAGSASAALPDTTPPNQPATVSVSPAGWSNAASVSVTWAGVTDQPGSASNLGAGRIQYAVNPTGTDASTWTWVNTAYNTANGAFTLDTSSLADGSHAVYVRGKDASGNYGTPSGAQVYIDRTAPAAPSVTVLPDTWTKENSASLSWTGLTDLNDLLRVEYALDGGARVSTGLTDKTHTAFPLDIAALADGEHTVSVRGTDEAGNVGAAGNASLYIDRSLPVLASSAVEPEGWTDESSVTLAWTGAKDDFSGLSEIAYALDGGESVILPLTADGSEAIDVSALSDGQHTLTLRLTDSIGNSASFEHEIFLDCQAPVLELLSPADGLVVTGVLDIWGSVTDGSLAEWTLTAMGESGQTVTVATDTVEKHAEQLGVLDTAVFADGESVEVLLTARDQAGHESTVRGVFVKADHTAQPVRDEVTILFPEAGETVMDAGREITYAVEGDAEETDNHIIVDGAFDGKAAELRLALNPIRFPEGSSHTLSILSMDAAGQPRYSDGMASLLLRSDMLQDESTLISHDGVTLTAQGAQGGENGGEIVFAPFEASQRVVAIRLHALAQGDAAYEYSTDGANWITISPDKDVCLPQPGHSVQIRAHLSPETLLRALDVTGVYEMNPRRFTVRLLKPVEVFTLTGGSFTEAMPTLATDAPTALNACRLYVDGLLNSESFTASLLGCADEESHTVAALGLDASGHLYGSGAKTSVLLRETPNASDHYESGEITLTEPVYALRLETLCLDAAGREADATYAWSEDGVSWTTLIPNDYVLLPKAVHTLYLRAELPTGAALQGLHLEGVTLEEQTVSAVLVQPPYNVLATDYGEYYKNEQLRCYILTWSDGNREDPTLANEVYFDICRNGTLIASTQETRYEDRDYISGADYTVSARRVYPCPDESGVQDSLYTYISEAISARKILVPAEEEPEVEEHRVENFQQDSVLNALYGGNYTYSSTPNPPSHEFALDQSLLGPHRFCSLGFEPVNFNTGNFFLQTQDLSLPGMAGSFDLIRTYNTKSNAADGPFGAKWETNLSHHLRLFADGSVAWRRGDGSEIIFYRQKDGSFVSNSSEYETLAYDSRLLEYRVSLTDGTAYVFTQEGLLAQIEADGGAHVTRILRDEQGFMTGIVTSGQEKITVEMDDDGHIVRLTLPSGEVLLYRYQDRNLTAFTDESGATTQYQYDSQGRMTAWYDAEGVRQVLNRYDRDDRVIAQTDANGGQYTLRYEDGRTITTDAEGNSVAYSYDEWGRTTRVVDALGGETRYTYGRQGEMVSMTDPLGNVTTYAYNEHGDKIAEVDPRGAAVRMTWDDDHHLLSLTDQNGHVTAYTYDDDGNLLTETAPDGGATTYAYDRKGRMIEKMDALGNVTRYEYVNGLLTKIIDPMGHETAYTYDANGNMLSMTDALGSVTLYEYDAKGNLLSLTFADGTSVMYTYDAMGRQTSMTDPQGNVTKYTYNGLGQLKKTTLPDGTTQSAAYTRNGQIKSVTDALENRTSYTYDGNGNCLTVTDPMGNKTLSEYDAAGNLLRETNTLGGVTEYAYDAVGLPIAVTDPTGATQTMTYDLAGNLLTRTLPGGATISVAYDSMNRPVRQVNALGGVTEITYDLLGRITRVTDPLGAETAYTYDANGNLLTMTDALGNVTAYAYDALNRVTSETAPDGGVTWYEYDGVGNLAAVTDALGYQTRYQYDVSGNLAAMTDALGQTVSLSYDKNGNATAAIQKNGGILATGYDKAGRIVSETDANGNVTRYRYNKNGLVTRVTDALEQQAFFSYDAMGNIVKITAPGNGVTLYEYDSAGRVLSMTDPEGCVTAYGYSENGQITGMTVNGNATSYEYDAAGNIAAVTDAEGRRVAFGYDLNGNLTETIYPDGTKDITEYDALGRVVKATPRTGLATAYEYDAMGNVLSVTQGNQVTRYAYDLLGRLVKVTTPDGAETAYAYDALGNLTGETDALGNLTQFSYTAESLLEKVTYANGVSQSLAYDLAGNVTAETDAEGNTKQYQYDKVNRLTAVIDELGNKARYQYDALDNIAKVTDALGHVTRYTYDKNGNLTSETDALGNKVKYAYTPEGWLESITKADGTMLTFEYDKTGSLLTQNVGDGQKIQSSYNEIGMVTEVSGADGTIVYQYNEQGYLVSVTNVNGDVVSYAYDAYGNKTSMTYPDGRTVRYTYDSMNRMTGVTGLDGEVTRYAYDALGRRTETASGTLTTTYRYDCVGNLLEQITSGARNIEFTYSYNRNGYITGEVRAEGGKTTESTYAYDALGQLTDFRQSTGYGESYAYDKAGNMTSRVISGMDGATVALSMRYNEGNQMVSMAHGSDKIAYKYDKNGSLTRKTLTSRAYGKLTDTYAYNALDQLTAYEGYDGYRQQFAYDANGMRRSKTEAGNANRSTLEELLRGNIAGLPEVVEPTVSAAEVPEELAWATTEYLYDLTQEYYQVIQETRTDNSGRATTAYAYGLERIAAYTEDSKTSYVYDGRGSVAQAISAPVAGEAVSSALPDVSVKVQGFSYTAFGEQMGSVKVSGFSYNAEAYDAATGMLNLRARQYEPAMNRFSQKDIVRGQAISPLSLNRYAYCENEPIMHTDPSGETVLDSIGNWWNKAKQTTVGKVVDTLIVQPIVKRVNQITKAVASGIKSVVKSAAEKAAKEYNTEAFQLFSSILKRMDSDGVYYSEKFKDIVDNMQNEIRSLDPSDVNYKKKAQEIVAKYCDYFNQHQNSLEAVSKLSTLLERGDMTKVSWLAEWKAQLQTMNEEKEKYPPQIRALIEQAASEVIFGKKTTLTNAKFNTSDTDLLAIAESKYLDFYKKLQALLYPSGVNMNSNEELSEQPSSKQFYDENPFGTVITSTSWNNYYGEQKTMSEDDWRTYAGFLVELSQQKRLLYGKAYTAADGTHTSLKYTGNKLYIDCWGLVKTGAKIYLTEEVVSDSELNGPVRAIYDRLNEKGDISVEKDSDTNSVTYPDLKTGYSIFIDNSKKTEGYDHVMVYIKDFEYVDEKGIKQKIANAVVGIGSIEEGLQIYNLDEYLPMLRERGLDVKWGNQFN